MFHDVPKFLSIARCLERVCPNACLKSEYCHPEISIEWITSEIDLPANNKRLLDISRKNADVAWRILPSVGERGVLGRVSS
ncbi:hypothetical protein SAY87_007717 [Trapa incisa]|uniref:Uncharacterized protein n=1 Tax=Trapa incisa TaxID=236973 RepID=A0AAN7KMR1_9MYRT|nr:hypothetical protein SAY87_007717 [Trapa incisa]